MSLMCMYSADILLRAFWGEYLHHWLNLVPLSHEMNNYFASKKIEIGLSHDLGSWAIILLITHIFLRKTIYRKSVSRATWWWAYFDRDAQKVRKSLIIHCDEYYFYLFPKNILAYVFAALFPWAARNCQRSICFKWMH